MPRIGFLGPATAQSSSLWVETFLAGMRDLGHVEGSSFTIEYRWADGQYDRLPALAQELVRLKVDVLVTFTTPGALAAKRATATIPIVVVSSSDAVRTGIVASLARPGGNITGSTFIGLALQIGDGPNCITNFRGDQRQHGGRSTASRFFGCCTQPPAWGQGVHQALRGG